MMKFCNDGRCPRTRSGEESHEVHKIINNNDRDFLCAVIGVLILFYVMTPHFTHITEAEISYLDSSYLAILIGFTGFWYARRSNTKLENHLEWSRYVQHATTYFNDESWENARIYYDKVLEITPKNLISLNNAGASLSHLEKFADALPYYERILQIEPDNVAALNNKGLSLDRMNRFYEAKKCYEKALAIDHKDINTLNNMGVLYLESYCDYDKSIEYFDRILSIAPNDVGCLANKARALLSKNLYEGALDCCNKALQIDLRHIESLNQKGIALFYLKRFSEVTSCGKLLLEINPLHTKQLPKKLFQSTTLFNMAIAFASLEKYDEAISYWSLYLVTKSDDVDAWKFKGDCLASIGNSKEAIECYKIGLQIDPKQPYLLNNMGIALGKIGKYVQAIMCFHEALRIRPNFKPALFNKASYLMGNKSDKEYVDECFAEVANTKSSDNIDEVFHKADALTILERYDEAIDVFNEILNINPKSIKALRSKGNIFLKLENNNEALKIFNDILQINPQHIDALNNKGDILSRLGHYERAIECYDLILKIDPVNRNALYNKGHTIYQLLRFNQALECFDSALEVEPNDNLAWNNKGNCLAQLGKLDKAIECYTKSHSIDPEHDLPIKNLSLVYARIGNYVEAWKWWYKHLDVTGSGRNQIDAILAKIQRFGIHSIRSVQYGDVFMILY